MTTAHDIERSLYDWAPRELAMAWDNVGLLVGDPAQEVPEGSSWRWTSRRALRRRRSPSARR